MRGCSTLFWRLVLGLGVVSTLACAATAAFLYFRFDAINTRFREDTLRSFAQRLAQEGRSAGWAISDGKPNSPSQRIFKAGGRFAIVLQDGAVVAGSAGVSAALMPPEDAPESFFTLPETDDGQPTFGLSLRVSDARAPLFVQVAFPANHVIFDSVLEEFVVDIGWIWLPFLFCMLATNVIVARVALKPLSKAVQQAEAIGPNSVATRLAEGRMPSDVLALVRAVNYALDRLQQGYQSLEEFVGDVAHELRTPLAIIKAQLALSKTPVSGELANDFAKMERLVQQLLDRVKLGGLHFEPDDVVDLHEVARDAAGFLAPLIIARGRSIEIVGADTPVYIRGARDFIFRALRNLIENAAEHAPPGTTVTVMLDDGPSVAVLDRGPGFPAAKLDPESRRKGELRSERPGGLGLGLSIVERTMAAHQGYLELTNRPGGGASATLHFSAKAEALPSAAPPPIVKMPKFQHGATRVL
jgi:signal transduction histidine kinase